MGCIGIGTVVPDKRFGHTTYKLTKGTVYESKKVLNKNDILALRGEPYKKVINENHEDWYYRRELAWGGIMPVVVLPIPIPLLLPYGFRDTIITFENDEKTKEIDEYGRSPIAMCSLLPTMWIVHDSTNNFCHVFKSFN